MIRPNVLLATALAGLISLSSAASVSAQNGAVPAGITPREIDAHLQFLSSDLLEGRAPATRGGQLAEEYIASQLKVFGVDPGVGDSSYFQRVPRFRRSGKSTRRDTTSLTPVPSVASAPSPTACPV